MNVREIIKNFYKYDIEKKAIVNSDAFIDMIESQELQLKRFINSNKISTNEMVPVATNQFGIKYMYKGESKERIIDKTFMIKLYEDKVKKEIEMLYKNKIINVYQNICKYCGSSSSLTIDHVFPKSKYIPLAIVPLNTIYSCFECNKNKSDFISKKKIFYPEKKEFLYQNINLKEIKLDKENGLNVYFDVIDYSDYIKKLKLKNTISNIINFEISAYLSSLLSRENIKDSSIEIDLIIDEFSKHKPIVLGRDYMKDALNLIKENKNIMEGIVEMILEENDFY